MEDGLDRPELARLVVVGYAVELGLGLLEQLLRLAREPEDLLLDAAHGVEQAAQHRVLPDDPRVVPRVCRGGHQVGQRVDVLAPADLLELPGALELVAYREHVDRLGLRLVLQAEHRVEDQPVARAVEVLMPQPDVDLDPVERLLGEQDRAENRDLRLLVLRRPLARGLRLRD